MDKIIIPAEQVPSYRTMRALRDGVGGNLLFKTWGGIGDQICAEPTLRFALDTFKNVKVSLATELPELFTHLNFHKVYDLRKEKPNYQNYFVFDTITHPETLTWEFMSHCVTHCVDFPSLCALRCQLPVSYRRVMMKPPTPRQEVQDVFKTINPVFVHAGAHWESKTFPVAWWNEVLKSLLQNGFTPVLIGKECDDNRTTVQVDPTRCVDLRNKTSLLETIWLLQKARYVVTNDSSPLHMAATGNAWIAFVATAKHPDYIKHWRAGGWSWRMENFGRGGMWDIVDNCPNKAEDVLVDKIDEKTLMSWLPNPGEFAEWFKLVY